MQVAEWRMPAVIEISPANVPNDRYSALFWPLQTGLHYPFFSWEHHFSPKIFRWPNQIFPKFFPVIFPVILASRNFCLPCKFNKIQKIQFLDDVNGVDILRNVEELGCDFDINRKPK